MSLFIPVRLSVFAFLISCFASPIQVWGGNQGWVAGGALDNDGCGGYGYPCGSFQGAFYNFWVNTPNFEVTAENSGSYGGLSGLQIYAGMNVAKNYTFDGGEGNLATIISQGISIAASGTDFGPDSVVVLRNITMYGEQQTIPAISIDSFATDATIIIENCKIYGYQPGAGVGVIDCTAGNLIIKNCLIEGNIGDAIIVSSGQNVSINGTAIKCNSGNGLNISGGTIVDISDSVITQNAGSAIYSSGTNTVVNCVNNVLTSNATTAFTADSGGFIRISNNDIYNNADFIVYSGTPSGTVETANNNRVGNNGSNPSSPTQSVTIQ